MKHKFIIVIPARYKSSRFPGKPLANIAGKSMILRVWEICCKAIDSSKVYVATDDKRIEEHCLLYGINVVMTSESCLTGTDRIYEVSKKIDADIYVNVQGDEPLVNYEDILRIVDAACANPGCVINAMSKINNESDFRSPSVPKVITKEDGKLLYMSRAAIPTNKNFEFISAMKQVCIYAFPKQSLKTFSEKNQKTPIENIEDIEIIRFLELGYNVNMVEVESTSYAVDFPKDIERIERVLNEKS